MKQTVYFEDGSFVDLYSRNLNLPDGYFLAQIGEYQQAPSGNPAVITLRDWADTVFNDQWQLYFYAVNFGMLKNNVSRCMGNTTELMNSTGVSDPGEPRRNAILEEDMNSLHFPYLDKLRTDALNCHAVRDYDDKYYQVWTMDGSHDPIMADGAVRPKTVTDVDKGLVRASSYFYRPETSLFAFIIPNNFNTKPGNLTTISPFPGGLKYSWTPDPNEVYTFFPLVSRRKEPVLSEKRLWKKVSTYQSPYRRL